MGFACPVCETPQQDAIHLANHLAFTAMVHGDEHEAWLDEHVPEWPEYGESELAEATADLAPEADYEQVFEDTVHRHGRGGDGHQHDQRGAAGQHSGIDPEAAAAAGQGSLDEEARAVLEEARGLTAEMLAESGADPDGSGEATGSEGSGETTTGDGTASDPDDHSTDAED